MKKKMIIALTLTLINYEKFFCQIFKTEIP